MKLAIMQPYLFPYLGYFAMAGAVDRFVFLDDAQFIKQGWINRNRWAVADQPAFFTFPVTDVGASTPIEDVKLQTGERWRRKLMDTLSQNYSRLPNFPAVSALFANTLSERHTSIAELAKLSITEVCGLLEFKTEFVMSSRCYGNADLQGVERVLDICKREGATHYVNLPGGAALYDRSRFESNGILLEFVPASLPTYQRYGRADLPGLSVLDALMFLDADALSSRLVREPQA